MQKKEKQMRRDQMETFDEDVDMAQEQSNMLYIIDVAWGQSLVSHTRDL